MSTASLRTSVTIPADMLEQIDGDARGETRSRSQQILHLVRIGLAGRARLAELERLAANTTEKAAPRANTAAADHLAQHAALTGLDPSEHDARLKEYEDG